MAQYSPLSGEGLFDVAAKLYNGDTAAGIGDLLSLNPTIDLDAEDLFGQPLTYTADLRRVKPVFIAEEVIKSNTYITRDRQSVWDLSIQLYGDLSKIGILLEIFPNLDDGITLNTEVNVELQTDPIAQYFLDKKIIVATDLMVVAPFRLLEDGSYRLLEDGSKRLLE